MTDGGRVGQVALPVGFRRLFYATSASNLGDGLRVTVLPLLAATLTRDPLAIGAVSIATMGPWLLAPVGGAMVDRGDRVRLMVAGQLVRGLAVAVLVAFVLSGALQLWVIYAVAVVVGLGEVVVDSAAQSMLPALVGPRDLERANGRLIAGMTVTGEVVGGPLGGLLFAVGAAVPLVVDAVTFVFAGGLLASLRSNVTLQVDPAEPARTTGFWQDVRAGMRALWDDRLLRPLAVLVGVVNVAATATASLFVLRGVEDLGMSEAGYGLFLGVGALGGLGGSLLADRTRRVLGRPAALVGAAAAASIGVGILAAAPNAATASLGLAMMTLGGGTFNVVGRSLRQAVIEPELMGRVIASFRLIGLGGAPVGAVLGGLLARATSVQTTMAVSSAILALVTLGMVVTVRRIPPEHR